MFDYITDDPVKKIPEILGNEHNPVFIFDNPALFTSTILNAFKTSQFFVIASGPNHYSAVKKAILDINAKIIDVLIAVASIEPHNLKSNEINKNWYPIFRYY